MTVSEGTNVVVGSRADDILPAVRELLSNGAKTGARPELWDGMAGERIAAIAHEVIRNRCGVEHSVC